MTINNTFCGAVLQEAVQSCKSWYKHDIWFKNTFSLMIYSTVCSNMKDLTLLVSLQKNQRELAKMRKCLRPEELVSHMGQMDTQTQHEELEKSYQAVVEEYRRIIERLATQAWSDWEVSGLEPAPSTYRWSPLFVQSPHHHRLQLQPRGNSPDVTISFNSGVSQM